MRQLAIVNKQFGHCLRRDSRTALLQLFAKGFDDLLVKQSQSLYAVDQFVCKHVFVGFYSEKLSVNGFCFGTTGVPSGLMLLIKAKWGSVSHQVMLFVHQ
jgi:hypothetical protein